MNTKLFRYTISVLLYVALASNLSGCDPYGIRATQRKEVEKRNAQAKKDADKPLLTQLQIRQLQTRTYATTDTKKIMQVALAVLQDDGFVVKNANADMGLLTATKVEKPKQEKLKLDPDNFQDLMGMYTSGLGSKTTEATVTATPFGKEVRVRLSVRLSSTESSGFSLNTKFEAVTDPGFYQAFFVKLEKGIFIEQQNL